VTDVSVRKGKCLPCRAYERLSDELKRRKVLRRRLDTFEVLERPRLRQAAKSEPDVFEV